MEATIQLVSIPKNEFFEQGGDLEEDQIIEGERVEEQNISNQDVTVSIGEAVTDVTVKREQLSDDETLPAPGSHILFNSSNDVRGGGKLLCSQCGFTTHKSLSLMKHYNRVHQKSFPLELCAVKAEPEENVMEEDKTLIDKLAQEARVSNHNVEGIGETAVIKRGEAAREPLAGAGFHFLFNSSDQQEIPNKTTLKCVHCDFNTENSVSLVRHMTRVHEKKFSCDQCSFKTGRKEMLNAHITSNHSVSFKCSNCSYEAASRMELHKHVLIFHEGVKTFPCSLCSYMAVRKNHLDRHVASVHEMIKAFECSQCPYKSPRKDKLDRHFSSVHQKLKPFACTFCSYRASRKSNLTKHISNFHTKQVEVSL